jgi:two-component system, OmpR family, response regulator
MRLLLVEDDPMIGKSVQQGLRQDGFSVDWVQDGTAADLALANEVYDLMLLDLGLPKKNGSQILGGLRAQGNPIPVLILTARDAIADRVKALDGGADDFLMKPFDLDELSARVRALLRRRAGRTTPSITHGNLVLNPATHEVSLKGRALVVSAREFAVLMALLDRPGVVLSRAQLEEKLYGWDAEVESNAVEVYIHSLRKKLGRDFIKNIRGVGYRVPTKA